MREVAGIACVWTKWVGYLGIKIGHKLVNIEGVYF
jgi:hypothetical protein